MLYVQVNCESMPLGPDNPYGVGFTAKETEFDTEQEAIREVDPRRSRVWKIKNPHSLNPITGERLPVPLILFGCYHINSMQKSQSSDDQRCWMIALLQDVDYLRLKSRQHRTDFHTRDDT